MTLTPAHASESACPNLFRSGPLWALLGLFSTPEAIKRAESVRIASQQQGVVRGKLLVGRVDGSPVEKFAYQIEKRTGYRVLLSTEANDERRVEGFVHRKLKVFRKTGDETMAILSLRENEARKTRLSLTAPHEGTHAWLDSLDKAGEGTHLSIAFQDFGGTYSGSYSVWMSAQELKAWSQDTIRVLRTNSESEIVRNFQTNTRLPLKSLFGNIATAIEKLETIQKLSARARIDLEEGSAILAEMRKSHPSTVDWESRLFVKTDAGELALKPNFEVSLKKSRTLFIPLNTKTEWELALAMKSAIPDSAEAQVAFDSLYKTWQEKLAALSEYNAALENAIPAQIELMKRIRATKSLSLVEYSEIRRQLSAFGNLGSLSP